MYGATMLEHTMKSIADPFPAKHVTLPSRGDIGTALSKSSSAELPITSHVVLKSASRMKGIPPLLVSTATPFSSDW